jgi:hypothetical protein
MKKNSKSRKDTRRKGAIDRFQKQMAKTGDDKKKAEIQSVIDATEKNISGRS